MRFAWTWSEVSMMVLVDRRARMGRRSRESCAICLRSWGVVGGLARCCSPARGSRRGTWCVEHSPALPRARSKET